MAEYKGKYKSVYNPEIEFESDYIAREVARDLMYHNQYPLTEYDLNDLPPADVRPVVRGRWIVRETAYEDTEARCSECGFTTLINEPGNGLHMLSDLNYCPGCGSYNGAERSAREGG